MNIVKKIIHISDIHIRLYYRNKEYKNVLENLKKFFQNLQNINQYITIITGDIFHSKTQLSPEAIATAHLYLDLIAKYTPLIIIPGNHDANLSNDNRLDALTPIVDLLNNPNIHYYKETGWYKFSNLDIYACSVFDQRLPQKDYIYPENSICLYHGIVSKVKTQNNFILYSQKFKVQDFSKFQFVLLGDIHLQQTLSKEKPLMVYAGSLIQSNYGQLPFNHGVLIWDLQNKTIHNEQILNNYAYYNILIQDGQITQLPQIKAKYPKIKLKYKNTSINQLQEIKQKIRNKYNPYQITLFIQNDLQRIRKSSQMVYSIQNIHQINYQQKLISQYNQKVNITPQADLKHIFEVNQRFNKTLDIKKQKIQTTHCKLKSLKFDNFFCYGEGNYIDFQEYNGLVGILGQNAIGKSSIIDILLFMLFDTTPNTVRSVSVLNTNKDYIYGKLQLYIDNQLYVIQKQGKLDKKENHLPIKIKFYKVQGNQIYDLSGKQRYDTKHIINTYIGNYFVCSSTNVSSQGKNLGFIQLKNTARKDFINDILNLNIFDKLYNLANDQLKVSNTLLSNYDFKKLIPQEERLKQENKNIKNSSKINDSKIKKLIQQLQEIQKNISHKTFEIKNVNQEYQNIDIDQAQNLVKQCQKRNEIKNSQLNMFLKQIQEINQSINQINQIIQQYEDQVNKKRQKKQTLQQDIQKYNQLLKRGNEFLYILNEDKRQMQLLQKVQYDQNCTFCMSNPLTQDAISKKQKHMDNLKAFKDLNQQIQSLQKKYNQYQQIKQQILQYDNIVINLKEFQINKVQIQKQVLLLQKIINQNNKQIQINNSKIKLYNDNITILQNNKKLRQEIQQLRKQKLEINNNLKLIQSQQTKNSITIALNSQKLKTTKKQIENYHQINSKVVILQRYKQFVSRNGLQYYIMSNIIQILQSQVNNVLQLITNFNIQFILDGKNIDIMVRGKNLNHSVDTCSGFQKFIISLAMRYALAKITNICKYDFFIIDQGFGVMDSINLGQLQNVFKFLSDKFKLIIIVSHMDSIKALMDNFINIKRDEQKGFSKVI